MYKRFSLSALRALLLLCPVALACAADNIDARQLRLTITGNTVEGRIVDGDATYRMYFHPSGRWVRQFGDGKTDTGNWSVDEQGALCIESRTDRCRLVKQRGEGQYDLYGPQGELELTIDSVTLGNPDKLQAPAGQ